MDAADAFERAMIRHQSQTKPTMTLHGITILFALVATLIYVAFDCNLF